MNSKQRNHYLLSKLLVISLCLSSTALAKEPKELDLGEKDLKSFSPTLHGSFTNTFEQKKHGFTRGNCLVTPPILSEYFEKKSTSVDSDTHPKYLLDPEMVAWVQLPYAIKIERMISLDSPLAPKEPQFDKYNSDILYAGYFEIPASFKKRHLKNLPEPLVHALKQACDKRLPYLGVISQQSLYDPIPAEEYTLAKNTDRLISRNEKILQNFDACNIDILFQDSNYVFFENGPELFVFPEKYSLVLYKATPSSYFFSADPLLVDASSSAFLDPSSQNITFLANKELTSTNIELSFAFLEQEPTSFEECVFFDKTLIAPAFVGIGNSCGIEKLSTHQMHHETSIHEIFVTSVAVNQEFLLNPSTEPNFPYPSALKQHFEQTQLDQTNPIFRALIDKPTFSSCDFLATTSKGAYSPQGTFFASFVKRQSGYKQGIALSPNFSFDAVEKPLYLASLQLDPSFGSMSITQEKTAPLTTPAMQAHQLAIKQEPVLSLPSIQSMYEGFAFDSNIFLKDPLLEKRFFEEALALSIATSDLDALSSHLHIARNPDSCAFISLQKESFEHLDDADALISFTSPENVYALYFIESAHQDFIESEKHLDALTLCLNEREDLIKPYLDEKLALFEIHTQLLDSELPAHVIVAEENISLPSFKTSSYENALLLSYQKALRPRLSEYTIFVDKPHNEDRLDPIISYASAKVALAGNLEETLPSRSTSIATMHAQRHLYSNLEALPNAENLRNYIATDDFIHDLQITPNPKGTGYLFSVTLLPQQQKLETNCPQNYIFLIDRSGSIDKTRFQSFKQGVMKSLLYLKDCDTFNIITFDTEMSKMSHESVFATQATKHGAKRYLENQKRGYQYGIPNVPQVLLALKPLIDKSSLPTTIVLLTSGKTLENYNKEIDGPLLKKQLKSNKNSFTLFTAGCQDVADSNMLEMLSLLNRGEYMISQTNAAFPRKLAALVKHATYLAASNVLISSANRSQNVHVDLYPNSPIAPNIYGDKPYTIVGKIDKLADFDLVLQGRFCDNWIMIKKKISFSAARHGGHSIIKDFKTLTAYNQYHEYFEDGAIAHLEQAQDTLKPYRGNLIR